MYTLLRGHPTLGGYYPLFLNNHYETSQKEVISPKNKFSSFLTLFGNPISNAISSYSFLRYGGCFVWCHQYSELKL